MVCSNLTILFPTQSRNGRATRANRRSPSGSYSVRPTVSKARRGCSPLERSVCRLGGKPIIRPHVLVKSTGTKRARSRHGTDDRFTMAKCGVDRCVHLQGRAGGHGGSAWLALSAALYYSISKSHHRAARIGSTVFRRALSAVGTGPHSVNRGMQD